jgi:serine/threonine protein kinase
MGAVYRSLDQVLDREVAVKVFRPDRVDAGQVRRQQLEIATLARLNHPGLVALYDAGSSLHEDRMVSWLVMELIPGMDLGRYLEAGPLDQPATARLGADLGDALGYIHRRNIVHRDVKPGNIVMASYWDDEEPRPKLADFGIARMIDGTQLTYPHSSPGTAGYLSPEQVTGADVGCPSDVYSLGLVLLQCLTAQVEYPGTSLESALARLSRPPRMPKDLEPRMADLLGAMTETDPRRRPDAVEVSLTLRRIWGRDEPRSAAVRSAPAAAGTAPHPTTRLGAGPAARPHPVLPLLQTSQLTNATMTRPWPLVPERPSRQPLSAGQQARADSGPQRDRDRRRRRPLRLVLLATVVLMAVAAVLIPATALVAPRTSVPGPSPAAPALLDQHLQQLEESLVP